MKIRNKSLLLYYALLVLILCIGTYLYVHQALYFRDEEVSRFNQGAKGYVSDEVWYVDAARNILVKMFKLYPHMVRASATLVYRSYEDLQKASEVAAKYGVEVSSNRFTKINAIYVEANNAEAIDMFAKATNASDVVYGWILGDAENINNYFNLEHPPMAKYIIALFMYIFGDDPFIWRVPSIIMGSLTILFTFLVMYEISKSYELSLIATAFVAVDPLMKVMASIALLDIYVAAMTLITIYVALKGYTKESLLLLGFASTFKFTALLAFIPLLFIYLKDLVKRYRAAFSPIFFSAIEYLLLAVLSFIFFQILTSIPIIFSIGFREWFKNSITNAISWHLSAKCTTQNCPVSSTPWEWFFGINSFAIYIDPKMGTIAAQGLIPIYALCFTLMFVTIPYRKYERASRTAWYLIFGLFLGYFIIWLMGSRTQYSFYAVQLTPFIYIFTVLQLYEYLYRDNVLLTIFSWRNLLNTLWNAITALFT